MPSIQDHPLTEKEMFYASKPLACSSPIIARKNGKEFRQHPGYYMGYFMIERPSYYTTDAEEYTLAHNVWQEKQNNRKESIWN